MPKKRASGRGQSHSPIFLREQCYYQTLLTHAGIVLCFRHFIPFLSIQCRPFIRSFTHSFIFLFLFFSFIRYLLLFSPLLSFSPSVFAKRRLLFEVASRENGALVIVRRCLQADETAVFAIGKRLLVGESSFTAQNQINSCFWSNRCCEEKRICVGRTPMFDFLFEIFS